MSQSQHHFIQLLQQLLILSLLCFHHQTYTTATVTMESMGYTETNSTSSNSLSVTIGTTSVMSTPVSTLQSTGSNILIIAGSISTAVFILLVVTILVILIVSVLVCRRRWKRTSNRNDTFSFDERKADINQQSNGNVYWTRPCFV